MGMQGTLGIPGRARGVDDQPRFLGRRIYRREGVPRGVDRRPEIGGPCRVAAPIGTHRQHQVQRWQLWPYRLHLRQVHCVGDQRPRTAVGEPELQRVLAEQREQGDRNQAGLPRRDVGNRRLHGLRHENAHPVAPFQAAADQNVGQPVGQLLQRPEGVFDRLAILVLDDQGDGVGAAAGVLVADVHPHVEAFGDLPAHEPADLIIGIGAREHEGCSVTCAPRAVGLSLDVFAGRS